MNRRFGADVVARARLVLDDELLAQPFRQPLRHDARRDVRAPARGIGHDPTHRPGRIVERRGGADPAPRQSGQARGKPTGKVHAWDHGARLLLPAFVGANDSALAVLNHSGLTIVGIRSGVTLTAKRLATGPKPFAAARVLLGGMCLQGIPNDCGLLPDGMGRRLAYAGSGDRNVLG